jgi:hypothetical protein
MSQPSELSPQALAALLSTELQRSAPPLLPLPRAGGPATRATIRLFVSSTFADFYLERELLNAHVAPELRRRCQALNLDLVLIDLKWGVPAEENPTAYCMRQLELCAHANGAPYFLFLCGSRRGWVPARNELPGHLHDPPVQWVDGVAITVMEFLLGGGRGGRNDNALFALRHESFASAMMRMASGETGYSLPANWPASVPPPSPIERHSFEEGRLHQAELRSHIAASFPHSLVRYDPLPEAVAGAPATALDFTGFCSGVTEGMWRRIEAQYGGGSAVEEAEQAAAAGAASVLARQLRMQHAQHEAVVAAAGARDGPAPRPGVLGELASALAGAAARGGTVVLCGSSGLGKSTLLAQAVSSLRAAHPACLVLPHFIGLADDSASPGALARRIVARLWAATDAAAAAAAPRDVSALPGDPAEACVLARHLLATWAPPAAAAAAPPTLILIIDAVNQLQGGGTGRLELAWLPAPGELPPGVAILLSCTPDSPAAAALALRSDATPLPLLPMPPPEARAVLLHTLQERYGRTLSPADTEALLRLEPGVCSPLWQHLAVSLLCAEAIAMQGRSDLALLPATVEALLAEVLSRVERACARFGALGAQAPRLLRALLLAAVASPTGLRESEAMALVPVIAAALEGSGSQGSSGAGALPPDDAAAAAALPSPLPSPLIPLHWALLRGAADALLLVTAPGAEALTAPAHALITAAITQRYGQPALRCARLALAACYEHPALDTPSSRRATQAPALYAAAAAPGLLARSLCCEAVVAHAAASSAAMEGVLEWARGAGGQGGAYDAAAAAVESWAGTLDAALPAQRTALLQALGLLGAMSRGRPALWRALLAGAAPVLAEGSLEAATLLVAAGEAAHRLGSGIGDTQALLGAAVAIRERLLGGDSLPVAQALLVQAEHLKDCALDIRDGAGPLYQRALAIAEQHLGAHHPMVAAILSSRGYWLLRRGECAAAHATYERCAAIQEAAYGPYHSSLAETHFCQGDVYSCEKDFVRAAAHQRLALAIRLRTLGPDHGKVATIQHNLAGSLRGACAAGGGTAQAAAREEALALCRASLATRSKLHSGQGSGVAATLESIAALLRDLGRGAEAAEAFEGALAARRGSASAAAAPDEHCAFWDAGGRGHRAEPKQGGHWGAVVCATCNAAPIRGVRAMCTRVGCGVDLCAGCARAGAGAAVPCAAAGQEGAGEERPEVAPAHDFLSIGRE